MPAKAGIHDLPAAPTPSQHEVRTSFFEKKKQKNFRSRDIGSGPRTAKRPPEQKFFGSRPARVFSKKNFFLSS
jgi:hypothetical protein